MGIGNLRNTPTRASTAKRLFAAVCALCFLTHESVAQIVVTNDQASGTGSFSSAISQAAGSPNSLIEFSGANGNIAVGSALSVSGNPTVSAAGTTALTLPDAMSLTGALNLDMGGVNGTISGSMSDGASAGSLTITDSSSGGGGALHLTQTNAYSGGTTITGGAGAGGVSVFAGAVGALGSGGVTMTGASSQAALDLQGFAETIGSLTGDAASTLDLDGAALNVGSDGTSTTFAGLLKDTAGTGSLVKNGAGTLTLSGTNTYAGGTTINGGTIGITDNASLGTGTLTFNGGTLQTQQSLSGLSNAITLTGAGTIDADGMTSTISGTISGSGPLTFTDTSGSGGGVIHLTQTNAYTGGTNITAGSGAGGITVDASAAGALGSGGVAMTGGSSQAILNLEGLSETITSLTGDAASTIDLNGAILTVTAGGGTSSTFSGVIEDTAGTGTLIKSGAGIFVLNGSNTFAGGTDLIAGTLGITGNGSLGLGPLTISGGTLQTQANVSNLATVITLNGTGTMDMEGNSSTFSGAIGDGVNAGSLVVINSAAAGSLTLSGANTYSGGTTLNAGNGTLGITNNSSLGTGALAFESGVLQTQQSLTNFANAITLNPGGTIDMDGQSSTFSGVISDGTSPGSLTIENSAGGSATIVLSGDNTYSGGTTLQSGIVGLTTNNSLGTGPVTISGGTLQTQQGFNFGNAITAASSGAIDADGMTSIFSGVIGGSGSLTFTDSSATGGGVINLTQTNGYTGGTNITAGSGTGGITVEASAAGALGSGGVAMTGGLSSQANLNLEGLPETIASLTGDPNSNINLNGATLTVGGDGTSTNFEGVIQDSVGTGVLIKTGSGVLTLSGDNTYAGGTTISGGLIGVTNSGSLGAGSILLDGGGLQTQQTFSTPANISVTPQGGAIDADGQTSTFSGAIVDSGGPGVLTLTDSSAGGGGQINLNGTNTYSGGTNIIAGSGSSGVTVLTGSANSIGTGAIVMQGGSSQANLNLQGFSQTFASLSGDANSNVILGGATLTTGADNTNTTFAGVISDGSSPGSLLKTGNGTFVLSGANSYSGGTTIDSGAIQLGADNALPTSGALAVVGGTFDMNNFNQTLGAVTNAGTIKTGNGSLTAASYSGTGTLDVVLAPAVTNLNVSGTANLTGGVLGVSNRPAVGTYTVVNAGTLTGTFSQIQISPDFVYKPTYSPTQLILKIAPTLTSQGGQTANESAVGNALFQASANATGDLRVALDQLDGMSPAQLNAALDQASPITLAGMSGLQFAASDLQRGAIGQHLAAAESGSAFAQRAQVAFNNVDGSASYPGTLLASAGVADTAPPSTANAAPKDEDIGGWFVSTLGTVGRLSSQNGASGAQPGYSFVGGGATVGGDFVVNDNNIAGIALGFIDSSANVGPGQGAIYSQSLRGGVYSGTSMKDFHLNLYLGTALDSFNTTRNIPALSRSATATPQGTEIDFDGQTGYDLRYGTATLTPLAGLSYDHLSVPPFTESGAGGMDLAVNQQDAYSLRSNLGAKLSYLFRSGFRTLTPYISGGFEHEFEDQARSIDAQFASNAGGPFTIATAEIPRNRTTIGAGFSADWGRGLMVRFDYLGDFGSGFDSNTLNASARWRF